MADDTTTVDEQTPVDSTNDQVEVNASEQSDKDSQGDSLKLGDEEISKDELMKGYMRQSDYTRKTQELADLKRQLQAVQARPTSEPKADEPDEIKQAKKQLADMGFVTKDEVQTLVHQQKVLLEDQKKLDGIISSNPDLRAHKKAIQAIGKTDTRAWEDIIADYGFMNKEKISTRSHGLMGEPTPKTKPEVKSVADMTEKEYEVWKKSKGMTGKVAFD